jgi:TolB protein
MRNSPSKRNKQYPNKHRNGITLSPAALTLIIMINAAILGFFGWFILEQNRVQRNATIIPAISASPQNQEKITPSPPQPSSIISESKKTPTPISNLVEFHKSTSGTMIISLSEAGYFHLFAYHPENLPLTRLTFGEWDDIQPAISPDGSQVAFASHRGGQWDIYTLDLTTGETVQITNDRAYDGAPSWSGDGKRLAFEKYSNENLDIYITSIDGSSKTSRVTTDSAHDFSPAWNPTNNEIAFTSTRGGDNDIWIIDVDQSEGAINFTFNTTIDQHNPSWSPDGKNLAWISTYEGYPSLFTADKNSGATSAQYIGSGNQATWDPTGQYLLSILQTPDQSFLTSYHVESKTYQFPPMSLSGRMDGVSWGSVELAKPLPSSIQKTANMIPNAPWGLALTPSAGDLYGRQYTVDLPDVRAPYPALNGLAIEAFLVLRDRIHTEVGWDVLSDLENAFVPLTQPLPPERSNDWLYTGRAFALNPVLIDLDWMKVVREDFGSRTYWRIYLKTRFQDGSQGKPISQIPWDFNARFSGNTTYYEEGGALEIEIPKGYWVDFTKMAIEYGWERQPALSNWQRYYFASRFNVFAITSGLNWEEAMLQLWPPEIFLNPNNP